MKIKSFLTSALLGLAALGIFATKANAQISAVSNDLILDFRATAGDGSSTNIGYSLGPITTFITDASSFSLNLAPDLSTIFNGGGTWNANTSVLWSVLGTSNGSSGYLGNSSSSRTLYYTVTAGGQSTPPAGVSAQTTVSGNINQLYADINNDMSNTTAAGGLSYPNSPGNTYSVEAPNIGSYFTSGFESALPTGSSPVTMELYDNTQTGSSPSTPTEFDLGTFSLSSAGVLTFTAVPEPSTYALLGFGAVVLLFTLRRHRTVQA